MQAEKLLKTFLNFTRMITAMLYSVARQNDNWGGGGGRIFIYVRSA